jgi:serine protease
VAYAEPDYIMRPMLIPNDPQYNSQWHYHEAYGINLPQAWDITTGNSNIVVAVIDTGHRPHVDLASRIVGGYDFISNVHLSPTTGTAATLIHKTPATGLLLLRVRAATLRAVR